jgi:hypothetical protein
MAIFDEFILSDLKNACLAGKNNPNQAFNEIFCKTQGITLSVTRIEFHLIWLVF